MYQRFRKVIIFYQKWYKNNQKFINYVITSIETDAEVDGCHSCL